MLVKPTANFPLSSHRLALVGRPGGASAREAPPPVRLGLVLVPLAAATGHGLGLAFAALLGEEHEALLHEALGLLLGLVRHGGQGLLLGQRLPIKARGNNDT